MATPVKAASLSPRRALLNALQEPETIKHLANHCHHGSPGLSDPVGQLWAVAENDEAEVHVFGMQTPYRLQNRDRSFS